MGGEADHRVNSWMQRVDFDVVQKCRDVWRCEEKALPQLGLCRLIKPSPSDLSLDVFPGLKRWLFVRLGVNEPFVREVSYDGPSDLRPVPGCAKRGDLLTYGYGSNGVDAPSINMPLKIGCL
jgi:hypothetical protein